MRFIAALLACAIAFPAAATPATWGGPLASTMHAANTSDTVAANSSLNNMTSTFTLGTPSSVSVTSGPSHGTTSISGTTIRYTPTGGYSGSDSYNYRGYNVAGFSNTASDSITVTAPPVCAGGTTTFTSGASGTYTQPANCTTLTIVADGGGGAGTGGNFNGGAGGPGSPGGGSGEASISIAVSAGQTLTYSVGSPGAGGNALPTAGQSGTATTVSGTVTGGTVSLVANGGGGGTGTGVGGGGTASGGTTNIAGSPGGPGQNGGNAGSGALGASGAVPGGDPGGGGYGSSWALTGTAGGAGQVSFTPS